MNDLKEVIETKEATIEELQSRLAHPSWAGNQRSEPVPAPDTGGASHENVLILSQAIKEREEKIENLQQMLEQASRSVQRS